MLHPTELANEILNTNSPNEFFSKYDFKLIRSIIHPDKFIGDKRIQEKMKSAFQKLYELKARYDAGEEISEVEIIIGKTKLVIYDSYKTSDICNVYRCKDNIVLKKSKSENNNDLVQNEIDILKFLDKNKHEYYSKYIPFFISGYEIRKKNIKLLTMMDYGDEYISLVQLKKEYPELDPKHIVWIFNRLLTIIGFISSLGVTHGAIIPEHVLIRKRDHALMLIDWSYAVRGNDKIKAIVPSRKAFYPPEVLNKNFVGGYTDIYMAAKTVKYLWHKGPKRLKDFFHSCMINNRSYRPTDAWTLLDEFKDTAHQEYGKRKFIELK